VVWLVPPAPVCSTRLAPDSQITLLDPSFLMYLYSTWVDAGRVTVARQLPRVPCHEIQVSGTGVVVLQLDSSGTLPVTKMF